MNVIVDKELYKKMHYREGSNTCPYCGRRINGSTPRKGAIFLIDCPNDGHELWKKAEKMIRDDEAKI